MLHQNAMQVRTYTKLPLKFVSEIAGFKINGNITYSLFQRYLKWVSIKSWQIFTMSSDKIFTVKLHKKWSFPLEISSVNVTKSAA